VIPSVLADIVLALHLLLAILIATGLFLIPVGHIRNWAWVRNRRLRITHTGLMFFVATEAVLGFTCPLTILEYQLRQQEAPSHFIAEILGRLLYWNAPLEAFMLLYIVYAVWVIFLWKLAPPSDTETS